MPHASNTPGPNGRLIDEVIAAPGSNVNGITWTPNQWGGVDAVRPNGEVRLASEDEGYISLYRFDTRKLLVWKASFDNAPAAVIRAAVRVALNEVAA